jgi:hypothetical protein
LKPHPKICFSAAFKLIIRKEIIYNLTTWPQWRHQKPIQNEIDVMFTSYINFQGMVAVAWKFNIS